MSRSFPTDLTREIFGGWSKIFLPVWLDAPKSIQPDFSISKHFYLQAEARFAEDASNEPSGCLQIFGDCRKGF